MVHELLTDQRREERVIEHHDEDLMHFCATVFDIEPPGSQDVPWCLEVSEPATARGLKP